MSHGDPGRSLHLPQPSCPLPAALCAHASRRNSHSWDLIPPGALSTAQLERSDRCNQRISAKGSAALQDQAFLGTTRVRCPQGLAVAESREEGVTTGDDPWMGPLVPCGECAHRGHGTPAPPGGGDRVPCWRRAYPGRFPLGKETSSGPGKARSASSSRRSSLRRTMTIPAMMRSTTSTRNTTPTGPTSR